MNEQWVGIGGFDEYQVSDLGRVRSVATGRIRRISSGGTTLFREDGRSSRRSLRQLVIEAFGEKLADTLLGPRGHLLARGPTPEVVGRIRSLHASGTALSEIGRIVGRSRQYVHNVTSGKRWANESHP